MNQQVSQSLLRALALHKDPRGPRPGPGDPVPDDVRDVLQIVSGDEQALLRASECTGEPGWKIREAAVFYVQQVFFDSGGDSYRTLGVNPGAPDERIKMHHRWLVRWLHPDRNPDQWEASFADRVNRAWQDLRTPERREEHDRRTSARQLLPDMRPLDAAFAAGRPDFMSDVQGRLHWLPSAIFGGLGVCAALALGLLYALHWAETRKAAPTGLVVGAQISPGQVTVPNRERIDQQMAYLLEAEPRAPKPVAVVGTPVLAAAVAPPPVAGEPLSPVGAKEIPGVGGPPIESPAIPGTAPLPVAAASPPHPVPTPTNLPKESYLAVAPTVSRLAARPRPSRPPRAPPQPGAAALADSANDAHSIPAASPVERGPEPPGSIDDRTANRLIGNFIDIYISGDLPRLERMLTADARSARGGRDKLLAEYARVFADSAERSLRVSNVSWFVDGQSTSILASFEASLVPQRGGKSRQTKGDIRFDLRQDESGQWRIYRLLHDEHRG